ncbi:MAG TPA: DUF222 domain-containing protein [Acidimicrobiales bacterium]|nr:DUF222 domain-containing protein [Acidimicrobiales bacterium]
MTALEEALDHLVEAVTAEDRPRPTGQETVRLFRAASRLQAVLSIAASDFADGQEWAASGARSGPAWLSTETRLPTPECRRAARLGRRIHGLAHAEAAWLEGRIGAAHAAVLVGLGNRRTMYDLTEAEESLVGQAESLRFDDFAAVAAYWKQHADPEGTDSDEEERRNRRDVYLVESLGGPEERATTPARRGVAPLHNGACVKVPPWSSARLPSRPTARGAGSPWTGPRS